MKKYITRLNKQINSTKGIKVQKNKLGDILLLSDDEILAKALKQYLKRDNL